MRRFALPGCLPGTVLLALVIAFAIAWGTQPGASQVAAPGGQAAAVTSIARSCPPSAPGAGAAQHFDDRATRAYGHVVGRRDGGHRHGSYQHGLRHGGRA